MRDLSAPLVALLAEEDTGRLAIGVEILTDTPIRLILRETAISIDSNTYTPDAFGVSRFVQDLRRQRQAFTLSIQNAEDNASPGTGVPWSTFVHSQDINKKEVRFHLFALKTDTEPFATIFSETRWYVSGWELDDQFRLRCGPPEDVFHATVPVFSVIEQACGRTYGQGACTNREEDNGFSSCPHDINGCIARTPVGGTLPIGPGLFFMTKASRRRRGAL